MPYGTVLCIANIIIFFSTEDYNMLSSGTQPNLAYGAGSAWLQGANTDEDASR